jgi:hypothetical protein
LIGVKNYFEINSSLRKGYTLRGPWQKENYKAERYIAWMNTIATSLSRKRKRSKALPSGNEQKGRYVETVSHDMVHLRKCNSQFGRKVKGIFLRIEKLFFWAMILCTLCI